MIDCAIIIATYGHRRWADTARVRALPSAQDQDARQVLIDHQTYGTACGVRNDLAREARARWLCFLDADDQLGEGYLKAMQPYLQERNLLLAPYVKTIPQHGPPREPVIPNAGQWPETNELVTATLIERDLFNRLGGFKQEFWPWPDWELWLRAHKAGARYIHVPDAIYILYDRPHSANKSMTAEQGRKLHATVKAMHIEVWQKEGRHAEQQSHRRAGTGIRRRAAL